MINRLRALYPYNSTVRKSWKAIAFISGFIFFFVFFFRTTQIDPDPGVPKRLLLSFLYGLVTFSVAIINTLIFSLVISQKERDRWQVWKEMVLYLIHLVTIAFVNHLLSSITVDNSITAFNFIKAVISTTVIGAIPISLHILNEQRKLLKTNLEEAQKVNQSMNWPEHQELKENVEITVEGITMDLNQVLYIESNKNYLIIVSENSEAQSIRYTLSKMTEQIKEFPFLLRCHRAFIVNTKRIEKVDGNAQGLRLVLSDENAQIPVSRPYIPAIKEAIQG